MIEDEGEGLNRNTERDEGKMEGGVQRRTAVIVVYAACGSSSAAGEWQQAARPQEHPVPPCSFGAN